MSKPDEEKQDFELFIGSKKSYSEYKRKHQLADTKEDEEEVDDEVRTKKDKTVSTKTVLSKDTLTSIDEETMTILRRTRCAHKYDEVFMQSSLDFYDQYYNDTEITQELKDARQIRRIYRSYTEYLNAIEVRNRYIDTLIDKYGEDTFLKKLSMGLVKDWIPPMPKLSKKAEDYELYLSGIIPLVCETLSEEEVNQFVTELEEEADTIDVEYTSSTVDSYGLVKLINDMIESDYYGYGRGYDSSVSTNSMEDLNKIFRSWYKADGGTVEHEFFRNSPEKIRERFEKWRPYQEPGLLTKLCNGEEIKEPEPNMNEQVYDEVTHRTMTRKELSSRQTIRFLAQSGWSESRLLNYQHMGSSLERMKRKTKANRKRHRDTNETGGDIEFMYGSGGINPMMGVDPMYSESDDLMSALSNLMRGD